MLDIHFRYKIRMRGEVSLNVWSDCSTVHKKQTHPSSGLTQVLGNTILLEVDFLLSAWLVASQCLGWLVAGSW